MKGASRATAPKAARSLAAVAFVFSNPLILLSVGVAAAIAGLAAGARRAVLSPPDIVSQTLVSLPLFLLFEASIWVIRVQDLLRRRSLAR